MNKYMEDFINNRFEQYFFMNSIQNVLDSQNTIGQLHIINICIPYG